MNYGHNILNNIKINWKKSSILLIILKLISEAKCTIIISN